MAVGNFRPGIPRLYLIGDFGALGAVQRLGNIAEVHDVLAGDILLFDFHILGKLAGNGLLCGGVFLQLYQKLLQRALIGRGADVFAVHIQAIRGSYQANFLGEVLLQRGLIHYLLPAEQAGGILNQGIINRKGLAQSPGCDSLQIGADLVRLRLAGYRGNHLAIIGDGNAQGIGAAYQDYSH